MFEISPAGTDGETQDRGVGMAWTVLVSATDNVHLVAFRNDLSFLNTDFYSGNE